MTGPDGNEKDLPNRPRAESHDPRPRAARPSARRPGASWFIDWPQFYVAASEASNGEQVEGRWRFRIDRGGRTFLLSDCPERTRARAEVMISGHVLRVAETEGLVPAFTGSRHDAECASFGVADVLPGWRACGPHGEAVPAILRSLADLPPERLAAIADRLRDGDLGRDARWPERLCWGSRVRGVGLEDPRRNPAGTIAHWTLEVIARKAPEWALDPEELMVAKIRLGDPGWVHLHMAVLGAIVGVIFPDVPYVADRDPVARWDAIVASS